MKDDKKKAESNIFINIVSFFLAVIVVFYFFFKIASFVLGITDIEYSQEVMTDSKNTDKKEIKTVSDKHIKLESNINDHDKINLEISVNATRNNNNQVFISGKSNLPSGTRLIMTVLTNYVNGYYVKVPFETDLYGNFKCPALDSETGLRDGVYKVMIIIDEMDKQNIFIQEILGMNRQYLTGDKVIKIGTKNNIKVNFLFVLKNSELFLKSIPKHLSNKRILKYKDECYKLLNELLNFKDKENFSSSAQYEYWLRKCEYMYDFLKPYDNLSFELRQVSQNIKQISYCYVLSNGNENLKINSKLTEVKDILNNKEGNIEQEDKIDGGPYHLSNGMTYFLITCKGAWGCLAKDKCDSLLQYLAQEDYDAFDKLLNILIFSREATLFQKGNVVFVMKHGGIFSDMVKVRKKGDTNEYWIPVSFIR